MPTTRGILVADDEPGIAQMLEFALQAEGFRVWLAHDGRQALDLVRQHGTEIGVLLLDVRMPDVDGPTLLKEARQLHPGIACCFMSGDWGAYSWQELEQLSDGPIFQKPFNLSEVIAALKSLTNGVR